MFTLKMSVQIYLVIITGLLGLLIKPSVSINAQDKNLTDAEIQSLSHPNISGEWV